MTPFIIAAAVITLIALGILIMPLLRTRNTVSYERQAQNIHYAKERLEELEAQLKNASISATDYEALKLEIESTLAHDIDIANNSNDTQVASPRRSNKLAIGLLSVFLPLSALGFYLIVGTPEAIDPVSEARPSQKQVDDLIADIETRLDENPNDLEGWQVLSQTYLSLGRYSDAKKAYQRVLTLGGETAFSYASLADATALAAGGQITEEASEYIQRALTIDPDNSQALWLAGLGAAQSGDQVMAKQHWSRLAPLLDDSPQQQQELRDIIRDNFGDSSVDQVASQHVATATPTAEISAQTGLTVMVSLNPEISQLADANDFVFIFAKASQGPPAPLAVKRLRVADLPTTVTLSDSDAMVAPMTLSKFEDVVVSARISKSGQPVAQAGDLQSDIVPTKNTNTETINLNISNIVK
ncbi:MAG: c-type cytochrome biogenesis protein CcmI [Arenicella sp.]|nr:c-type cytochrome biogenesis protein CcmI [Arenicella sp.]